VLPNMIFASAMPPLRVLFAVGSMEIGGAERQVVRYLQGLDRSRFRPGLYLVARRGPLLTDVPRDVPIFAFEDRVLPSRMYLPGRTHRRQVRDLAALLDTFSVDVLVTRTFQQSLVAGAAIRQRPTPLVAVEANDPPWDFPRLVGRFARTKKRLVARAYHDAAAVVALSEGARDGLCRFYKFPRDRVTVLPNFVDVDAIDRLAAENGPALDPAKIHVVSLGRLAPQKGHDVLFEAIDRLQKSNRASNLHFHLIGEGPARQDLERFADSKALHDRLTFAGALWNPFPYLKRCDLFCLSSRYEGMPGALLEAMACGVPVLATDCPSSPREILAGGEYGTLIPPSDPQALAEALAAVTGDLDAARRRAVAARQRIEATYAAPVGIERLQNLLLQVASH
jgi:glycosyltransferase involved in cell wall biosynthesis